MSLCRCEESREISFGPADLTAPCACHTYLNIIIPEVEESDGEEKKVVFPYPVLQVGGQSHFVG